MFDFRLHLSNSCQHDCVRFALRPFLTTFEEQQKKAFFTISLIIWHKDMNIKILMGLSSYFLSTLPLFSLCREIPHPTAGGALLRSTSQVPLRAGRESLFLSKGLISKPLVRLFYWQTISGNLHKRKQNKNKEAGETKKDDLQHCWKSSSVRPQGLEPWTH